MISSLSSWRLLAASALFNFANGGPIASNALVPVTNFGANPTNLQMSIYVPTKLATNPAIILALHGCMASGASYAQITKYSSLADTHGFLVVYPTAPHDNNCWDVGTNKSLTHGGGGDSNGLVNMIQYMITTYKADPKKVFVMGSSSGAMMTNVLSAVYPDVIAAGSAYSGVAAGCLAGSPGFSPQTANPDCANGKKIIKTQEAWVAEVKTFYPGYNGTYPRMQVWHGTADGLVFYPNLGEEIKEWSGLDEATWTKNLTNTPQSGYTQMVYGDGTKFTAYSAVGVGHTVPVHEDLDLKWFGIV